jgi:hypothetical protein
MKHKLVKHPSGLDYLPNFLRTTLQGSNDAADLAMAALRQQVPAVAAAASAPKAASGGGGGMAFSAAPPVDASAGTGAAEPNSER